MTRRLTGWHARRLAAGVVWLALYSCGESPDCGAIGAPQGPMFEVTVVDAATGLPAWWGAQAFVEDGAFRIQLRAFSEDPADSTRALPLRSDQHRVGVYTVRVERAGFRTWESAGHRIVNSGCFLTSLALEARLERV